MCQAVILSPRNCFRVVHVGINAIQKRLSSGAYVGIHLIPMLLDRFKPRLADALQALKSMEYSIRDFRAGRSPRAYSQEVFRHAKAAQVASVFNQLTLAWSQLDVWLRRDIPEPTITTPIVL